MRTLIILASAGLLIAAAPITAHARGAASQSSPGSQFRANGAPAGTHGASSYAPGQHYRTNGATGGLNGASGYAPGRTK